MDREVSLKIAKSTPAWHRAGHQFFSPNLNSSKGSPKPTSPIPPIPQKLQNHNQQIAKPAPTYNLEFPKRRQMLHFLEKRSHRLGQTVSSAQLRGGDQLRAMPFSGSRRFGCAVWGTTVAAKKIKGPPKKTPGEKIHGKKENTINRIKESEEGNKRKKLYGT